MATLLLLLGHGIELSAGARARWRRPGRAVTRTCGCPSTRRWYLTRLDDFLGQLCLGGPLFAERVETVAGWVREAGTPPLAALGEQVAALLRAVPADDLNRDPGRSPGLWGRLRSLLGR